MAFKMVINQYELIRMKNHDQALYSFIFTLQKENIGNFLSFCEKIGLVRIDLFQTVDLFEGQNIPQVWCSEDVFVCLIIYSFYQQVIYTVFALGRKVIDYHNKNYNNNDCYYYYL